MKGNQKLKNEEEAIENHGRKKSVPIYVRARAHTSFHKGIVDLLSQFSAMLERCTQYHEEKREDDSSMPETRVL